MSGTTNRILIVNKSLTLSDADIQAVIAAVQAQITEDFAPIWNFSAKLDFASGKQAIPKDMWPLYVLDHSSQAGVLGYHQDSQNHVSGRIFAGDDKLYDVSWTVDLTHELLEMLADSQTDTMINLPDGRQCLQEVCDAVEDDAFAYTKQNVLVTDFVLPAYFFKGPPPANQKYDFCGKLGAPAPKLTAGGYLGIYDPMNGEWTQITAHLADGSTSLRSRRHGRTELAARKRAAAAAGKAGSVFDQAVFGNAD